MKKLLLILLCFSLLFSCSKKEEKGYTACDCVDILMVPKKFAKGSDRYKWDVCKRKFHYATNARKKCPSYKNSRERNVAKSRAELNNISSLISSHSIEINIIDSLHDLPDPNDAEWIKVRDQLQVGDALYIFQEGVWVYNGALSFILQKRKTKKLAWWKEWLVTLFGAEFKDLTECCDSEYIRETNVCSNCEKDNLQKMVANNTKQVARSVNNQEYQDEKEYYEDEEEYSDEGYHKDEEEYFDERYHEDEEEYFDEEYHEDEEEYSDEEYSDEEYSDEKYEEEDRNEVFNSVENMPEFPGGDLGLMKYLQKNVKYPAIAKEYNITGKVYVSFIVDRSGSVTNVKIVRGVDKNLDAEAMRVVKSLPRYTPGRQRGKAVRVMFTIPINFTLN